MSILKLLSVTSKIVSFCLLTSHTVFANCTSTSGLFLIQPVCSCTVNSPTLAFGSYVFTNTTDNLTATSINVSCQSNQPASNVTYQITLGTGQSGDYNQRTMTNGQSTLKYNIYINTLYQTIWGDGVTAGTQAINASVALPAANVPVITGYPAYGRIPAQQLNLTTGNYTDTGNIAIIVNF